VSVVKASRKVSKIVVKILEMELELWVFLMFERAEVDQHPRAVAESDVCGMNQSSWSSTSS
jgi:hypothetical protein